MCDTLVSFADDGVLFAKNSDRDPNEAQLIEWHPAADHAAGSRMAATWIEIDQAPHTHAVVISRPWWMWGAEMGANEHGVVIGNEAVFTKASTRGERGLLGMDLLRLALERADTAAAAVEVVVGLLERHGQVGPCSYEHPSFTYHNSFLVADPGAAFVVETAGREWAVERVRRRSRSISNGLTIEDFARRHADPVRGAVARCEVRRRFTEAAAGRAQAPAELMATLRDNGTGGAPRWSRLNGAMGGPNMHAGGRLASSQTVASWVADLRGDPMHWVTATADPALSVFKPVRVGEPADLGPQPTNRFDPATRWWRHEVLHRRALHDWAAAERAIAPERDRVQARWLAAPPATAEAFARADELTSRWLDSVVAATPRDRRPGWLRRAWRGYDEAARLDEGAVAA